MTENMAYLPEVSPPSSFSETEAHYYVYGYNGNDAAQAKSTNNYLQYGVLYNWEAARISCPPGWHLPGNWEYNSLERLLGDQAGYKMKSQSGWFDLGNGDNSSGLNVLPGGAYKAPDGFDWLSKTAYLQTASIDDKNKVNLFTLTYNSESLNPGLGSKMNGFSVRCVR